MGNKNELMLSFIIWMLITTLFSSIHDTSIRQVIFRYSFMILFWFLLNIKSLLKN
jgi:hypothetical protein